MTPMQASPFQPDSGYAWRRLAASLAAATIGGVGMWSAVVALPAIQMEFGIDRGTASLPYTATMIGTAIGGIGMGRLVDRFGIRLPLTLGAIMLGVGYAAAALATTFWQFVLAQSLLIGMLGSSVAFGPLVADVSRWFTRRRGIAVAIVASGSYLAGAVWPPILQHSFASYGWRPTHLAIGLFCVATMLPLAWLHGRRPPAEHSSGVGAAPQLRPPTSLPRLQVLLVLAGLSCCIAMSMPQVHIVAYCGDLGYGPARGAEMLSLMLGLGVVSRLVSGLVADRIGGIGTLLIGSGLRVRGPDVLPAVRRPHLALSGLGPVRPVPGRHRPQLRPDRARLLSGARGGHADQSRPHRNGARHGDRRLALGRDLRPHRILCRGFPQWDRLESGQPGDRLLAAAEPSQRGRFRAGAARFAAITSRGRA